jgi:ATP-binding cassette, subfamily B, bacterial
MAWGGGGGWGGAGMGGQNFGGGMAAGRNAGLPFAGIPSELREGVERIVKDEPTFEGEHVPFSHVDYDRRRLTLRRFLAPHKWAMLGGLLLVLFETAAMQAGPVLTQIGIDHGIRERNTGVILAVSLGYFIAVGINVVASGARISWTGRVGQNLMYHLRLRIFSHFQRLSVDFFTKSKAGVLMTRMTSDLESLTQLFQEGLVQMVVQGLTMVFVAGVLFYYNVTLAAITLLAVVPLLLVATVWFRSASDRGYNDVRDRIADLLSHLQESLSGIRIINAYNRQRYNIVEHRNVAARYRSANNYTATVGATYGSGSELIGLFGQILILLIGGRMVLRGDLSLGELSAFVLSLNTFFAPIQQLVQLYDTFQKGQASIRKLGDLLSTEPTVAEKPDAIELPPLHGEIRLEDVTFGYSADRPVLRDVDLVIREGETFSLVGETGAGKSTIAKLVTRFHDPLSGRVLIDGYDLRDVTLTSLRGQLGIVPQEPFLFSGSIRDNIAFARPSASDDEVLAACRAVGIDDLIDRLPEGIHTPCHERGVSLSSGERQLLALARAFLSQPRVLVLDEATSNLDLRSEAKIEHALDVLLQGRTAIIIAHRLATAMRADRIAVVHDGRIVELGSHDELVAAGGRYARMYETWELHAAGERV